RRERDVRQGQARRRTAGLDWRQAETAGEDPAGDGGTGGRGQAGGGGRASDRGRKGTAAPSRRPQEAGRTGGGAIGGAQSQGATQLHRSGKPHHQVEGWLRGGL